MSRKWPEVPLGEVCSSVVRTVKVQPAKEYRTIGVRWWGEGAYEREAIDGSRTAARALFTVKAGDLIINKIWVRHGSVAIASEAVDGCSASNEFPMFQLNSERVLTRWIHWHTKTREFRARCAALSQGTSGKNRIRPERFLTIPIPLPPLREQRRIGVKIDQLAAKIDEARRLRQECSRQLDRLNTSGLRQVFNEVTQLYGTRALEGLLVEAGYGTSAKCHSARFSDAMPILRIPNVASEKIDLTDLKFASLSERDLRKVQLMPDDLLVVRTNGSANLVGRCAVVPRLREPNGFASYLIRLRCDGAQADANYVQWMLRFLRVDGRLFDFARTTAGQYNVSLGRLRAAELPVPPLEEQRRIVAYLDDAQARIDRLKALQGTTAAELDAVLPSILDKAFKGEL